MALPVFYLYMHTLVSLDIRSPYIVCAYFATLVSKDIGVASPNFHRDRNATLLPIFLQNLLQNYMFPLFPLQQAVPAGTAVIQFC